MRYTVLGTGAIGCYYGGRLQQAGLPVDYLARGDYEYFSQNGLIVESIDGDFQLDKISVFKDPAKMPKNDVVLISMKTSANVDLPNMLRPIVHPGIILMVLQNGLEMEEELQEAFPEATVIGAMCFICSFRKAPGHICHIDKGSINASPLKAEDMPQLENIKDDFTKAGIGFKIFSDLRTARWNKLLWNIPFNGLSVLLNADTEKILSLPEGEAMVRRLMEEVILGAHSEGCDLSRDLIDPMINFTRVMVPYKPSMKLDYEAGRPMEIEYLFRKPLLAAKKQGVELPNILQLADQLDFLEKVNMESLQGK